ncbi:MAG: sulfatase-like hydrolase/transferase [Planctomycetes bacterium]|jgi:arylsulfatase A|nr:sulfatase-like hydrolase/transferase [Planctomycetota bacterium]
MMNRRSFLQWTGAAAAGLVGGVAVQAARSTGKPNIIFILADDYGIGGVGCYGSDGYKTPNLDALAQAGLRYESCYAMPLCAPTRGACMTGRYGFRTGVVGNGAGAKAHPDTEVCIAKVLKQAGYTTAVAGKWRQLSYFTTKEDAQKWGFDEFLIWGVSTKGERYWDPDYNHNGRPLANPKGKYGPDLLHEFVVDFIRRHRAGPFFVYYPMPLIHGPILRTPDSPPGSENLYADNIAYMDKLVGKLVTELDGLGLREKTLIVFVGDNGCTPQASGAKGGRHGGSLQGRPIEGAKGDLTEGGSRVPLIINWKGTTPAGQVPKDLVDVTDFYPTFAELAGAQLPAGVKIDGHSLAAQITGRRGKPRDWVFVILDQKWYVRDARWKLNNQGQLFDMKDAPFGEILVSTESADAQAARTRLQAVLDGLQPRAAPVGPDTEAKRAKRKVAKKKKG